MPIVNFGFTNSPPPITGSKLQLAVNNYAWNSSFGSATIPHNFQCTAAIITKISCNIPRRWRLYQNIEAQQLDLNRPAYVCTLPPKNSKIFSSYFGSDATK
ncbi:hypothetical protein [Microseira wollei]|uniref:Uncharacterized protein n=1 Tax=Microseira wollei NIES-4236 TaxID=2530354 RepID=A0AAV3XFK5_9CYAN|nr:hypothetical protein [Microseira wollei]GET41363.1 hypothetical protein MiSe_61750 [Microseira wollei NIES-4236]